MITAAPDQTRRDALREMSQHTFSQLPVYENSTVLALGGAGRCTGIWKTRSQVSPAKGMTMSAQTLMYGTIKEALVFGDRDLTEELVLLLRTGIDTVNPRPRPPRAPHPSRSATAHPDG